MRRPLTRRVGEADEWRMKVNGRYIQVRSIGEGKPLLLVNGLGAHIAMWGPLERALSPHFRILEFDAPGAGRSPTPLLPVSVSGLAEIAMGVLDAFDVERSDVLGYSMGGMITQQICADHSERVRRAVLVATSPGLGGAIGAPKAMANIATPVRYLSPKLYAATIGNMAGGRARDDHAWVREQGTLRLKHRPTMRGYASQIASLSTWSGLGLHARITAPTLVVAGDDDPLTPVANGLLLANRIPEARLAVMRGEGHLMLLDDRSGVIPAVTSFLEADDLADSESWQRGWDVSDKERQFALDTLNSQLQPWGCVSRKIRERHLTA